MRSCGVGVRGLGEAPARPACCGLPKRRSKHARSFDGFDEQILALYGGGLTTREIQRHLRELYGVDVSDGLISDVTGSIADDVRAWQSRPLEELYVVVYLDAMMVSIRDQQAVRKEGRARRGRDHPGRRA